MTFSQHGQHSDAIVEIPKWFLAFMLDQIGGEIVLSDSDTLFMQDLFKKHVITFWRDDTVGRIFLKLEKPDDQ